MMNNKSDRSRRRAKQFEGAQWICPNVQTKIFPVNNFKQHIVLGPGRGVVASTHFAVI